MRLSVSDFFVIISLHVSSTVRQTSISILYVGAK